ncbi:MAG: 3-oxoacyl-[acyl-carrier-protein] reductase [Firmicutes bacterium]|nr:3-oxoacyl-[acyl-carrier-protein] reductase [Bacillota bacterium]
MVLAQRTAFVTGASRGIGRAIAVALAGAGARVAVNYRSDRAGAEATAAAVAEAGGEALVVEGDVADAQAVRAMVEAVGARLGEVDILVNNAGNTRDGLLLRMSEEDWDAVVDTHLKGAYLLSRAVLRGMVRRRWGRIVNVASVAALVGNPGQTNYGAAKAGLIGFTRALAKEVASRQVTVNAVAPGLIATAMSDAIAPAARQALEERIPLGRVGSPEDVAAAVLYLASPQAGYVTGHVLVVDGGLSA